MRSRFRAILCLAVLCAALQAHGQSRPASTDPGLLLGLCGEECETLWITAAKGVWEVTARGKGIVTPRSGRFWRVGISRPGEGQDWDQWLVWAKPVGQQFAGTSDDPEDKEDLAELRRFGGTRHIELTFVGPDHAATRETFETWGPRINYNHNLAVMSLDELAKPHGYEQLWSGLPIGGVLGSEAERLFAFAAQSALQESESEEERSMYDESFLDGASSGWTIERGRGRWIVGAHSGHGSGAARGHYYGYAVPAVIPISVVGFEETLMPWELVLEEFPDAIDAFAAPKSDLVFVRVPGRLFVCRRSARGTLDRPSARLAMPEASATVLVQWALGTSVLRWTRALVPVFATDPPKPVPPPRRSSNPSRPSQ